MRRDDAGVGGPPLQWHRGRAVPGDLEEFRARWTNDNLRQPSLEIRQIGLDRGRLAHDEA